MRNQITDELLIIINAKIAQLDAYDKLQKGVFSIHPLLEELKQNFDTREPVYQVFKSLISRLKATKEEYLRQETMSRISSTIFIELACLESYCQILFFEIHSEIVKL